MRLRMRLRTSALGSLLLPALVLAVGACRAHERGGWSAEVSEAVDAAIARHAGSEKERPLAVFDFDNTMIDGDISYQLVALLAETGRFGFGPDDPGATVLVPEATPLWKALREMPAGPERDRTIEAFTHHLFQGYRRAVDAGRKVDALAYLVGLLAGHTPEEVHALALEALAEGQGMPRCLKAWRPESEDGEPVVKQQGVRTRAPITAMLARLRGAGFDIRVVSASPERVVEAVAAKAYGIPEEHVFGVRSAEQAGRITREILEPVTYRDGKVQAIEQLDGRRPVIVFGDAWTDWEMLEAAEVGVLIDRGKADLLEAARKAGLLIQPRFEGEPDWRPCPR